MAASSQLMIFSISRQFICTFFIKFPPFYALHELVESDFVTIMQVSVLVFPLPAPHSALCGVHTALIIVAAVAGLVARSVSCRPSPSCVGM